ncbi:MAG: hypothetical protein MI919_15820 [Holophagales bacterium]|nr:hypothetical protein [Holophagales bacterium]
MHLEALPLLFDSDGLPDSQLWNHRMLRPGVSGVGDAFPELPATGEHVTDRLRIGDTESVLADARNVLLDAG